MTTMYLGTVAVQVSEEFAEVVRGLTGPLELRDESGVARATVQPAPLCPWEPNLTMEEIDARCAQGGKSLEEILQRLGAR
ncbi:MAG: hypothetical protein ACRCZF_01590 [Gemmataceae bacterium]